MPQPQHRKTPAPPIRRMNVQPVTLLKRAAAKDGDDEGKMIVGYAAVHYNAADPGTEYVLWDDAYGKCVERLVPGVFTNALARQDDVRCVFNHDPNYLLGRTASGTLRLSVDSKGLRYECDPGDTTVANDVVEHLRRGDVTGSSFAFVIDADRWSATEDAEGRINEVREILDLTLYDASPVVFPAYTAATSGLRSRNVPDDVLALRGEREAERRRQLNHFAARARLAKITK
jgi:HK97 family phage prohead protease